MWVGSFLAGVALFKTKGGGSAGYIDPDHPDSCKGAPPPSGADKQVKDVRHLCETWDDAQCDTNDVRDWACQYEKEVNSMSSIAQQLSAKSEEVGSVSDNTRSLIPQSNSILEDYSQNYSGFDERTWAPGTEAAEIWRINEGIAAAIKVRKAMLVEYGRIAPGSIPTGVNPSEIPNVTEGAEEVPVAAYATGGAVLGLGIALAFVVASNQKKKTRVA
jgi:hypothetical protein